MLQEVLLRKLKICFYETVEMQKGGRVMTVYFMFYPLKIMMTPSTKH